MQYNTPSACPTDSHESDSQLIASALAGHQCGYTKLVSRHQDRLLTAIRDKVVCNGIAEDIVQDAFVSAFKNLKSFRSESGFYTWLYRIALNSRRYYLRNRHRTTTLNEAHETCQPARHASCLDNVDGPLECLERVEDCAAVDLAMNRLDEHHREILYLREFEGFDYRRIAEVLHLTLGTVRSRISRARAQLRQELTVYWTAKPIELGCRLVSGQHCDQTFSLTA
ncbi:MAG: sigma-70 family RNA polymerase sigma factor [Rubripirellula sp.]|nr:sigma-70 family RNA polymerase sigma factor [Rubripirellula sp.]